MTADALAVAVRRVATTDDPRALVELIEALRGAYPGDPEAEQVVRVAELKRRRLVQEN